METQSIKESQVWKIWLAVLIRQQQLQQLALLCIISINIHSLMTVWG